MTNVSSQIPDRGSVQYLAVQDGLDLVHDALLRMTRIRHEMLSARPMDVPGRYEMKLVGKLLNRRREPVGMVRVYISVPDGGDDIKFRVEWTRNAYGFWFWKEFTMRDAVNDIDGENLRQVRRELTPVIQTADGTVPLRSMNRMYKKIKKNRVRDKVAQAGMQRG